MNQMERKTLGSVGARSHQAGCQQSKNFIREQQQMSAGTRATSMEMTHTENQEGKSHSCTGQGLGEQSVKIRIPHKSQVTV